MPVTTNVPRGTCRVCKRNDLSLTAAGRIPGHNRGGAMPSPLTCPGSGRPSKET